MSHSSKNVDRDKPDSYISYEWKGSYFLLNNIVLLECDSLIINEKNKIQKQIITRCINFNYINKITHCEKELASFNSCFISLRNWISLPLLAPLY